jgi:hypothetical protein
MTGNGFALPRREGAVVCPGFFSNVLIGAFAAFSSWAFYGSGAGVAAARTAAAGDTHTEVSVTFSALAGAFLVGVAGAKWITNEVDKKLLKESVKIAATAQPLPAATVEQIVQEQPAEILRGVREKCLRPSPDSGDAEHGFRLS